jgi:hypothetical protein
VNLRVQWVKLASTITAQEQKWGTCDHLPLYAMYCYRGLRGLNWYPGLIGLAVGLTDVAGSAEGLGGSDLSGGAALLGAAQWRAGTETDGYKGNTLSTQFVLRVCGKEGKG